jgi:cyclopropane-fatty-acyl-phospholipid synthase
MPPPPQEVKVNRRWLVGRRHSKGRDANAISHHCDVSNRFYEWVLGPTMAYTCACYPREDATLEEAQVNKFDLVARKLGLRDGMRLLDVGCGWGGMVMHAAREYGVKALAFLLGKLKVGGRLLNHCITRPDNTQRASRKNGFINRYVFPDGELEGPGYLIPLMHDTGFEVRHEENLREHYAKTLAAWCANLDAHWNEAVTEVGQGHVKLRSHSCYSRAPSGRP